ncbi:MAG: SapC family protein [Polymorphobacter sp.]
MPLSSQIHPGHGLAERSTATFAAGTHAIPVTVDEFAVAQRFYPIVFGLGENSAPLALVGLNEGKNLYVDAAGNWQADTYVPAFVRRYPFILGKMTAEATDLTLMFDPKSGLVTEDAPNKLFNGTEPSETTNGIMKFCEEFEQAIARTRMFMTELEKLELLMDGEVTIQQPGMDQPAVYRGFRMINEEKFHNIRGDKARELVKSGMLGLVYAHLFSLSLIGGLFEKQRAAA